MADFFDDLKDGLVDFGKTVSEAAEVVAQKTEETVEVQKLKVKIYGLNRENKKDFEAIGKLVYQQFQKEGSTADAYAELCEQIQTRDEDITTYKEQIAQLRGLDVCWQCKAHLEKGQLYCPKCGAKVDGEFEEE